jgi:hypothetical protein
VSVVRLESEFNQNWNVSTGFNKLPSIKFKENSLNGSRVVALGQTNRQAKSSCVQLVVADAPKRGEILVSPLTLLYGKVMRGKG